MRNLLAVFVLAMSSAVFAQVPVIESGVSQELAVWRAAHYSDVRYKLNLTLEKMSPVLKGTIEIRLKVATQTEPPASAGGSIPIILDWRKLRGQEALSTISNVSLNGTALKNPPANAGGSAFEQRDDHLVFREGVVPGENVIKLDFTSPILTSGSAITRYIDKEDGSEYVYSLFVPSDASTAFPVFDQPDLKAKFELAGLLPDGWNVVSNAIGGRYGTTDCPTIDPDHPPRCLQTFRFDETKPISTYVFAFAAGPFKGFGFQSQSESPGSTDEFATSRNFQLNVYVRASQAAKYQPHAMEVGRLTEAAVQYLETYFDYKFPWPKYDLVLIPEFPFGGMEHAGATFVREQSIIFPTEPTKSDYINRATLIFHETAHQWFGDTVTMKWFDDLWLKEGFANFMAYKAMEKIMPEMNAWKVFYERIKQPAYATDSTKGTTAIYQPIKNLSAAKSAYGNIVYNKAPAFLRQAEFYLGEDKFRTAVRAFLKKHEYGNAGWEDLVKEFEAASGKDLKQWADIWIKRPGLPVIAAIAAPAPEAFRKKRDDDFACCVIEQRVKESWPMRFEVYTNDADGGPPVSNAEFKTNNTIALSGNGEIYQGSTGVGHFFIANYRDYGYGIFLLDETSRDYVLKNIQNEKDQFLRSMMYGALWDSVREGELDPKEYVELVIKNLGGDDAKARTSARAVDDRGATETDETIVQSLLARASTAINYYLPAPDTALADARASATDDLRTRLENVLIDRMKNAPTLGQKITFYRSFLNIAASENARRVLKGMLQQTSAGLRGGLPPASNASSTPSGSSPTLNRENIPLKTKDKFDIVTRLAILGDPDAEKLLAGLEKTETSDDAKRYAYAAHAAFATKENREKFWNDFVNNKQISESWIEAATGPFNSIKHDDLSLPYLQRALAELPNLKRDRKIFFVNGWLGAFIGGQKSQRALDIVNKFLADNPNLDNDLRLKILENVDVIERAVKIRTKYSK